MNKNIVVTIGREYGSGGREIGNKLAERMRVRCYDKELLTLAAKQSGMCKELFESLDERKTNSFLYSLVMDTHTIGYAVPSFTDIPLNHKIFLAQFEAIKNLAKEESCVIVGRCADYALEEFPNVVRIFISADIEDKAKRIALLNQTDEAKAKELCIKTDKKRANYYNYFTSKKWGDMKGYDLCINSSALGIEGTIEVIADFIKQKENRVS